MNFELNLEKATQSLELCLEKAGIVTPPTVDVGFGLDVSGSYEDEHREGLTTQLMARLVPWALTFDPDKKMELFTFSANESGVKFVGSVSADNYKTIIFDKVIGRVPGWGGGTHYSHLIKLMLAHFGWLPTVNGTRPTFLGKLFGKAQGTLTTTAKKRKSLIIINTDGDNQDKKETLSALADSESRKDEVYFLFLGVSNQGSKFPFLEKIGDQFNNTGFVQIPDINKFISLSDDELNEKLLSEELLAWLKA